MSQQHTTIIQTDYAPRILVQEDDGRWFKVLNWLFVSRTWAGMTEGPKSVLMPLLHHRRQDGLTLMNVPALADEAGLSIRGTQQALKTLLEHPAALLASHGPGIWEPLPERIWAGRAPACANPAAAAHAHASPRMAMRPPDQPEKDRDTSRPEPEGTVRADFGLAGWLAAASPLYAARPDGDPRSLLAALNLREPLLGLTADLDGLTAGEVWRTAQDVAGIPQGELRNPGRRAVIVAHRLFAARGLERPTGLRSEEVERQRMAAHRAERLKALGGGWAGLANARDARGGKA